MKQRRISISDCLNVMRGGSMQEAEYENGGWRHRIETSKMVVVVEFLSEDEALVVTTWRKS